MTHTMTVWLKQKACNACINVPLMAHCSAWSCTAWRHSSVSLSEMTFVVCRRPIASVTVPGQPCHCPIVNKIALTLYNRLLQQRWHNRVYSVNGLIHVRHENQFSSNHQQLTAQHSTVVNSLTTRLYNHCVTSRLRHIARHNMTASRNWTEGDCHKLLDSVSVIPLCGKQTRLTTTLCSEKQHPLTFSFISPWIMCGFKQKWQCIYPKKGRFWQYRN